MMLGFLLARAGVDVIVLEKHADFLRDFRGDTIHPSTLEVMHELGLLDAFLRLPHEEITTLSGQVGTETHPQGGMPDQEAVHSRRGIRYRAALGQVDPPSHAELVAALSHVLQERLLAPGQGLSSGLRPGELNDDPVLIDPIGHERLWATTDSPCQSMRWPPLPDCARPGRGTSRQIFSRSVASVGGYRH